MSKWLSILYLKVDDLYVTIAGIILSHCLPDVSAVQPVNRYFSAESPKLQPDLECLVGMDSADVSELYKVTWNFVSVIKNFISQTIYSNKLLWMN